MVIGHAPARSTRVSPRFTMQMGFRGTRLPLGCRRALLPLLLLLLLLLAPPSPTALLGGRSRHRMTKRNALKTCPPIDQDGGAVRRWRWCQ